MAAKSPLILVTNREPYRIRRSRDGNVSLELTTGGLVSALVPVVAATHGVWVTWNPKSRLKLAGLTDRLGHELVLVPVSEKEIEGYYRGFSNGALWPLCHYAIDRCRFNASDFARYARVNRKFADCIARQVTADGLVWIHDYHLTLVPQLLRELAPDKGRIAYFHHIPFPARSVFRVLPWRREVLAGLLGADLIGFHTSEYVGNFLDACKDIEGVEVCEQTRNVQIGQRTVEVREFPIGIDCDDFENLANNTRVLREAATIRSNLGVETLLLGVDRLDYTKGIEQRLEAMDYLLEKWPRLQGKLSLLQIAVPSRSEVPEYSRFKKHIDETIGRINGKFADNGWQPIHCIYRSISRRKLVAHYLAADVVLVAPLRDGMNLVAKEFCAARNDEDGVLVLSEFAGVSEVLGGSALLVNPFDTEGFAKTIAQALSLERHDRRARMRAMRAIVRKGDVSLWARRFLRQAAGSPVIEGPGAPVADAAPVPAQAIATGGQRRD
jgi:alpha,alpha-trehalose-phosphate synthase [UDP-forming]